MTPQELNDSLCALLPTLDRAHTVDRVIAGNPDQEICGVAVCWMPCSKALIEAKELGANVVVTHEPTFYDHFEQRKETVHPRLAEAKIVKERLINDLGLTVIRCHDVWDAIDEVGIPFEWAKFLGLRQVHKIAQYMHLYKVEKQQAVEFVHKVASKTASLGQSTVGFYGDSERMIEVVGIGTGCYSDALQLFDLGADLAISVDDITRSWIVGEYAQDTGNPVIVVNHGVSESCAMEALSVQVQATLNVPVYNLAQGVSYSEIRADYLS